MVDHEQRECIFSYEDDTMTCEEDTPISSKSALSTACTLDENDDAFEWAEDPSAF